MTLTNAPIRNPRVAPFPDTPAKLPGIAIAQAEDTHAADVAEDKEAEAEADEVVEGTNLDCEIPHITFGQRDNTLEDYNIGDVHMVSVDRINKQQLVNDIMQPTNPHTAT